MNGIYIIRIYRSTASAHGELLGTLRVVTDDVQYIFRSIDELRSLLEQEVATLDHMTSDDTSF